MYRNYIQNVQEANVQEAIEICLNKLYKDNQTVNNLTRIQMKKLLKYCVKDNHFLFDDKCYDQIDECQWARP